MNKHQPQIIIPTNLSPQPRQHEITAAIILARFFNQKVYFLPLSSTASADITIGKVAWEIKSPISSSPYNIQKHLREASHQSCNIVIDLRRSKLRYHRAIGYINTF